MSLMMVLNRCFLVSVVAAGALATFSGPASAAWTGSQERLKVIAVRPNGSGTGLEVGFDRQPCRVGFNHAWLEVGETLNGKVITPAGVQNTQSIAMAALLSGRPVKLFFLKRSDTDCRIGELELD
jgi:hypothetical protein